MSTLEKAEKSLQKQHLMHTKDHLPWSIVQLRDNKQTRPGNCYRQIVLRYRMEKRVLATYVFNGFADCHLSRLYPFHDDVLTQTIKIFI